MSASEMRRPSPRKRPSRLAAMRGRAILAAAMIAALVAISGCGGGEGGGIPQDSADSMLAITGEIEEANANGECDTAQSKTTELRNVVAELEGGETKQALGAMVTRLDENIDVECGEEGTTDDEVEPEQEPEPEVPVEPAPVPEEEPTEPAPVPEEEEEPAPPEQPPGEGGGPQGPPETPPGQSGGGPPTGGLEE